MNSEKPAAWGSAAPPSSLFQAVSNSNTSSGGGNAGQAKVPQRTYSSSSNAKGGQQQQQQQGRGGGGGRGGVPRNHSARGGGGGGGSAIGSGRGGVQRHHSARGGGVSGTGGGGRGSTGNGVQRSHSLRGGGGGASGVGVGGGGRGGGVQRHSSGRSGVQRNPSSSGGRGMQRNASGRGPKQGMIQRTPSGRGGADQQQQQQKNKHHNKPRSRSNSHDGSVASAGGSGSFGPKVDRTPWDEILLLQSTGAGDTELERSIVRHAASTFLECRGQYLQPLPVDPAAPPPLPSTTDADAKNKKSNKKTRETSLADATITSSTGEMEYWTPHERCIWAEDDREAIIQEEMNKLWSYKPLEVNDETRWKARSLREAEAKEDAEAARKLAEEEQLRKAVGILNKLSWTTLDRMTEQFLETLGCGSNSNNNNNSSDANLSKEVVQDCMALILKKAMGEPHFAELYAKFSAKLTTVHKAFKRTLLSLCQEEFYKADQNESQKKDAKDEAAEKNGKKTPEEMAKEAAEQAYAGKLAKKHYIGLMQFIGELYRHKLMKGGIMIGCLERLFVQDDEEKLECFTKLMTTAGSRLQADVSGKGNSSLTSSSTSAASGGGGGDDDDTVKEDVYPGTTLEKLWDKVYSMAGRPRDGSTPLKAPTLRIRFLLQDLIELKENGWVQRRKEEKAKTIAQIHKEVADEEQAAANRNMKIRRSQSGGAVLNLRRSSSVGQQQQNSTAAATPAVIDTDGFTQVVSGGPGGKGGGGASHRTSLRRAKSDCVPPTSSLQRAAMGSASKNASAIPPKPLTPTSNDRSPSILDSGSSTVPEYLEPSECGNKMKNILKEYFVGGDTADAVFSIEEIVSAGHEGSIDRGAAVIQDGILFVMESKEEDVAKFLKVMTACLKPDDDGASAPKIEVASLAKGLNDPLEFLRDVEIDAPLAASHLATIVATWTLELQLLELDFILKAPEFFLTNGRPADFLKLVLQKRPFTDDHVKVVEKVMTDEEKAAYANVREWIETP